MHQTHQLSTRRWESQRGSSGLNVPGTLLAEPFPQPYAAPGGGSPAPSTASDSDRKRLYSQQVEDGQQPSPPDPPTMASLPALFPFEMPPTFMTHPLIPALTPCLSRALQDAGPSLWEVA